MSTVKYHCQVCQDAGLSRPAYTSHNVKSPKDWRGKYTIVCPTILKRGCRYCDSKEHVGKFCTVFTVEKLAMERMVKRPGDEWKMFLRSGRR